MTDVEKKEKERKDRLSQKVGSSEEAFGDNEIVVRYRSNEEGTGLVIPKYYDYISLLVPEFNHRYRHHASGTHHNQLGEGPEQVVSRRCAASDCSGEAIYRLPQSDKRACSLKCYKQLANAKHQ